MGDANPPDIEGRLGRITLEGEEATLVFRRRLPHAIEDVWAAITDPDRRRAWFGETTIDPREGGAIEMVPEDPPVAPEAKTNSPSPPAPPSWTSPTRGLSPRNAQGFIPGGHAFLDRLEAALAGSPIPGWSARYAQVAAAYA